MVCAGWERQQEKRRAGHQAVIHQFCVIFFERDVERHELSRSGSKFHYPSDGRDPVDIDVVVKRGVNPDFGVNADGVIQRAHDLHVSID